MSANENEFQFELREKLYFNEGELVEELMNISLDPEISIEPTDSYVSIHGEIELRGEYKKATGTPNEEELLVDFEDFEAKRFVRSVMTGEDDLMVFTHRFPVEISVPSYRIQTIDEIQVEITNFDYEMPANDQLNITASASIYGIKENVQLLEEKDDTESDARALETEDENFEFEIQLQEQEREKENESPEELVEDTRSLDQYEDPRIEVTVSESEKEPEEEEHDTEETERQPEQEALQDVSYLTDMFRDEEEENYSKMRIGIVQDEDTIETIAERFEVSTLQLIKQNELEDDDEVNVGQLLYIPQK